MKKKINVTKPFLPPLEEFIPYLEEIWDSKILTNGGPFHQKLETALCEYLGVKHISLFSNGTLALVTALQALEITGEVITTPYSFVATSHALHWNGIKPVFIDIDPETLNLNPCNIKAAISEETEAILPVHVYGNPCDVTQIQAIADEYNLKVIYDAAHAFGIGRQSKNCIFNYGDLSVLSFHATKVFNTFEGGAIICPNLETKQKIDHLKNFGFVDEVTVVAPGINGKRSELNASIGLLQLKYINKAIYLRKLIDEKYRAKLNKIIGIDCINFPPSFCQNYSYFPILVQQDYPLTRDELFEEFKKNNIYARRYFYPLISDFPMYKNLPSANHKDLSYAYKASNEIICLPIYPDLNTDEQDKVIDILKRGANGNT